MNVGTGGKAGSQFLQGSKLFFPSQSARLEMVQRREGREADFSSRQR